MHREIVSAITRDLCWSALPRGGCFLGRVIYLGSATNVEDFRASVVPHLARHKNSRFYGFSLALKHENHDRSFAGLAPPGSLLVWVDTLYEPGVSAEQKRVGWWRNIAQKRIGWNKNREEIFVDDRDICSRVTFLKFSGDAAEHEPTRHGDFNADTRLQTILAIAKPTDGRTYDESLCAGCRLEPAC